MLLYFLESGDSCALSMGSYMGASKSSIRAVTERDTSLVMVPVGVGQGWMKTFTSWSALVLESYQTRLEEMLDAIIGDFEKLLEQAEHEDWPEIPEPVKGGKV